MDCTTVAAAMVAVCLQLPDLPEPADTPALPHWRIRDAVASYRADKTIAKRDMEWHGIHARAALGNTRPYPYDVFKDRKTVYLVIERGRYGLMFMPFNQTLAMRWEFE